MFKKIALAAALATSASFATYSFFPVGNAHTGQVEVGPQYSWDDNSSQMQFMLGGEFVVINKLEISLFNIGYQLWNDPDKCGESGHSKCPDSDGFMGMTLGARYQFLPFLAAALDINLPLNSKDVMGEYDPFSLYQAIQFSMEFIPGLEFGSELGLGEYFKDENITEGLILTAKAELDYTIAAIGLTPWVGVQFDIRLSNIENNDYSYETAGDKDFVFYIGAGYEINKMFSVQANFFLVSADEKESLGRDMKGVNAKLDINF